MHFHLASAPAQLGPSPLASRAASLEPGRTPASPHPQQHRKVRTKTLALIPLITPLQALEMVE